MDKLKKEDNIILFIITATSFVLCSAFLQMHYSSDTYCLIKWGYFEYPSHYFLLDGRLISTAVCYLAGVLKVPYNVYIIGMDIIGILFLSLSVWEMYKTLEKIMKIEKLPHKIMLILSTYVLIYNQFSLEFLLFPESAVMCLGVFTSVLAVTKIVTEDKYKYLKIAGLIFISTFSYQGLINIFFTLSILLLIIKQEYENKHLKENIVPTIKEILKIVIILLIVVIINVITIKIGVIKIGDDSKRVIEINNVEALSKRLKEVTIYLNEIWNNSMNMLPRHINSIVVILTVLLIIKNKKERKLELILKYIFLNLCIMMVCIAPMFIFNTGICGRVNVPIAEIWGISLILILMLIKQKNEKNLINIVYTIIIISFIFNSVMILKNTYEHIASNRVDQALGKTIKYSVEKYEKESGNKITKFAYAFDENPQQYSEGIRQIGSLTERKFACPWCVQEAVEFYCQRNLELVKMPINIFSKYQKKDYLNKYSELAQKVLNALLDHYMNEGIEDLGGTEILNLDEFRKIASATKIVKEFGGKQGYLKAIKELEDELLDFEDDI